MTRVKRGTLHTKKRRNLLKSVKGYRWGRKKLIRLAKTAQTKAGAYSYRDRRRKKREMRQLWLNKINATIRQHGLSYSKFIHQLKLANIILDRKILANLAENNPSIFAKVVNKIKVK
ncbi:MAG: 50S ribosomal protein L20 [Candidatus Aenigmarchaeota archaeon]|nr:50S ribosomal protein L20 [Candidatus Aenigmarchaeota archaeon]